MNLNSAGVTHIFCWFIVRVTATYPWSEEKVKVFVQQNLVLRISSAKVLQERVRQGHDFVHLFVSLWKHNIKQVKIKVKRLAVTIIKYSPSHMGSAAGPAPQCGPPCFSVVSAAGHGFSYWGNTAYWAAVKSTNDNSQEEDCHLSAKQWLKSNMNIHTMQKCTSPLWLFYSCLPCYNQSEV